MQSLVLNVFMVVGLLVVMAYLVVNHIKAKKNNGTVLANGVRVIEKPMGVTNEELATVVKDIKNSFALEFSKRDREIARQEGIIDDQFKRLSRLEDMYIQSELRCQRLERRIDQLEDRISYIENENKELNKKLEIANQTIRGYEKSHLQRIK